MKAPVTDGVFRDGTVPPAVSPGGEPVKLGRISDRATFQALRAGRRARRGAITVTYLPTTATTPPRVAFAVGKGAGGAVVRNRIRRRLRAGLRELQGRGVLPPGAYLLGGSGDLATMPWSALCTDLEAAVTAATGGTA